MLKQFHQNFEQVCCCHHFWFSLPIARMKFLVSLGEYDGMVDSFHTTFLAPILCWTSITSHCVASMIRGFKGSFPTSWTYFSFCFFVGFVIGWCITYYNRFLRIFVITLNNYWKQSILGKFVALFLRKIPNWLYPIVRN